MSQWIRLFDAGLLLFWLIIIGILLFMVGTILWAKLVNAS